MGPASQRAVRRAWGCYCAAAGSGLAIFMFGSAAWLKCFGVGLMAPGAGFLFWVAGDGINAVLHAGLAFVAMAGFLGALLVWFATGNVLAPVLYWLVAAMTAAAMNHDETWDNAPMAVVVGAIALLAGTAIVHHQRLRWGNSVRRQHNSMLAAYVETPREAKLEELRPEDIALARLLVDRAMQPIERFDGFEVIDQFQTAALRYQLNFAGYALSMYQRVHAPAFQAWLTEAQRRLIRKHCDPKVWSYWALENLWGNLERNPDPMARDNIMFTGFAANQIAMFHGASGDENFNGPGSLTFVTREGRRIAHDFPGMVRRLGQNMEQSAFTLVACEPNWIFPLCNGIGAAAMKFGDAANWDKISGRFADSLESEFLSSSGEFFPCRSSYVGLALPAFGGAVVQALPCFFYNATLPEVARRHWLVERRRIVRRGTLDTKRFWPVDTGNYRMSRAASYAATAAAAVEMGDGEAARLILARLDQDYPATMKGGVRHRSRASLWAHGAEVLARMGRGDAFRELIGRGQVASARPFISEADYPAVLPARAMARDGGLECVFYPGGEPGPRAIGLAGLDAGRGYRWQGGTFTADAGGRARLTLVLEGRTEMTVVPEP